MHSISECKNSTWTFKNLPNYNVSIVKLVFGRLFYFIYSHSKSCLKHFTV